jgi:cytidine deaminase
MREFCDDDFLIYMIGANDSYTACTLRELLPFSFSPDHLA